MPARLRLLSWNLQNYGTSKFTKYDLGPIIAKVMQLYRIDIAALIEISKNGHLPIRNSIVVELNNLAYQNNWQHTFVDVGDEGVVYIWHEAAAVGANAFRKFTYINHPTAIAGKVLKNTTNTKIYFPNTQTSWNSLPTKSKGRRPAYCAFETNDGAVVIRRFTFLDFHSPFNISTQIQAYSAYLYASSREILQVENFDAVEQAQQARNNALLQQLVVQPLSVQEINPLNNIILLPPGFSNHLIYAAADAALEAIKSSLNEGENLQYALQEGALAGVRSALKILSPHLTAVVIDQAGGLQITRAVSKTGVKLAMYLVASIMLPQAPAGAANNIAAAINEANNQVQALANIHYNHPLGNPSFKNVKSAYSLAAIQTAMQAVAIFVFPALPSINMTSSIIAGDFNIDYPDITVYQTTQRNKLNGGNAYTALLNTTHPNGAVINNKKTTRIGPTAFESQRIYRLKLPIPIQHINPMLPTYVPLDVTSLTGRDLLGYNHWIQELQHLARLQSVSWATLINNYNLLIDGAFDSTTVINNTNYYRANAYDNCFVRNATIITSDVIDVFSELGTWPADPSGKNYWAAAMARLNPIVKPHLLARGGVLTYQYYPGPVSYTITPNLSDAEQAAVFFDKFVSDHLPIYVEVDI